MNGKRMEGHERWWRRRIRGGGGEVSEGKGSETRGGNGKRGRDDRDRMTRIHRGQHTPKTMVRFLSFVVNDHLPQPGLFDVLFCCRK